MNLKHLDPVPFWQPCYVVDGMSLLRTNEFWGELALCHGPRAACEAILDTLVHTARDLRQVTVVTFDERAWGSLHESRETVGLLENEDLAVSVCPREHAYEAMFLGIVTELVNKGTLPVVAVTDSPALGCEARGLKTVAIFTKEYMERHHRAMARGEADNRRAKAERAEREAAAERFLAEFGGSVSDPGP